MLGNILFKAAAGALAGVARIAAHKVAATAWQDATGGLPPQLQQVDEVAA